jgi:hypothetical protein
MLLTEPTKDTLFETCFQMGKIRQPIDCTEAFELPNNLIEGTEIKGKLIEFQKSRGLGTDSFTLGTLSKGWWRGFLNRHSEKIDKAWQKVCSQC